MSSNDRNYRRLTNIRGLLDDTYDRDNAQSILKQSLRSNDIQQRDIDLISVSSPDQYAKWTTDERWKEFRVVLDDPQMDQDVDIINLSNDIFKVMDLELHIRSFINAGEKELPFLKVVVFFSIIHNIYFKFSDELQDELYEIKSDLVANIHEFQRAKAGMKRKSSITTSFQSFLVSYLGVTEAYVKKHISRYKKLIKVIFNPSNKTLVK